MCAQVCVSMTSSTITSICSTKSFSFALFESENTQLSLGLPSVLSSSFTVTISINVSTGHRSGDPEAVVQACPLLCHSSPLWPYIQKADSRGANYAASNEGMFVCLTQRRINWNHPVYFKLSCCSDFKIIYMCMFIKMYICPRNDIAPVTRQHQVETGATAPTQAKCCPADWRKNLGC